jgi:hypothetical protein
MHFSAFYIFISFGSSYWHSERSRSRAGYGAIFFLLFLVLKNSLITTRLVADAASSVDLRLARILLTASWAALVLVFITVTALRVATNKAWWIAPWFAALAAGSLFAVGLAWAVIWRVCLHIPTQNIDYIFVHIIYDYRMRRVDDCTRAACIFLSLLSLFFLPRSHH